MMAKPDLDPVVQDTRILAKINAAHRGAFQERFPGQLEHCLRLVTERLHAGLDKRTGVDPADLNTWRLLPAEIRDLAEAMYYLNSIKHTLPLQQGSNNGI